MSKIDLTVYRAVAEEHHNNPSKSISVICRERKVSYVSYNNWKRQQLKRSTLVPLELDVVAKAQAAGQNTVTFKTADLIKRLDENDKNAYAQIYGLIMLEQDEKKDKGEKE